MFGLQNCKLSSGHILQSAGLRPDSVLNCPLMECGVVMSHIVCLGRSKVSWNKKDMWSESLHIPRIPKDLKMSLVMLDNATPNPIGWSFKLGFTMQKKETLAFCNHCNFN